MEHLGAPAGLSRLHTPHAQEVLAGREKPEPKECDRAYSATHEGWQAGQALSLSLSPEGLAMQGHEKQAGYQEAGQAWLMHLFAPVCVAVVPVKKH